MADGDECDLDSLSALLEDTGNDSDSGSDSKEDSTPADARKNIPAAKGQAKSVDDIINSEEEIDMEALTSILEQDSDMEDAEDMEATKACVDQEEEVTEEDIAAFLDESSDNEEDGDDEEKERCERQGGQDTDRDKDSNVAADGVESSNGQHGVGSGANADQQDPQRVKNLQDELAMMQRRMMEIQNMLASSSSSTPNPNTQAPTPTPAAVSHSATPRPSDKPRAKQPAVAKSLSSTSSSSVSSTSSLPPLVLLPTDTHLLTAASATQADKATRRPSARQHAKPLGVHKSLSSTSSSSDSSSYSLTTKHVRTLSEDPAPQRPEMRLSSEPSSSSSVSRKHKRTLSGSSVKTFKSLPSSVSSSEKHKILSSSAQYAKKHRLAPKSTPGSCKSKGQTSSMCGKESSDSVLHQSKTPASSDCQVPALSQKKDTTTKFSAEISGSAKKEQTPAVRAPLGANDDEGAKKKVSSSFLSELAENGGCVNPKSLKNKLFGEDSDSDWEDMDGKSTSGPSSSNPGPITSRPGISGSSSSGCGVRSQPDSKDYITDKFSGLRVVNPKISNAMLASKMEGRRLVQVSTIHLKLKCPELQGDWVTIGVIVSKSESRKSQTGKTYSIMKLSDLSSDRTVSFFLFGQVYKQLWKMDVGVIIGILNPSIMDSMDKGGSGVAITVSNAHQVMEIGRSKDFGWCIAKTKRGASCSNVINKKLGDFCTYHVQTAYRKQSAKRSELHGSCPGNNPRHSLKSKILANNTFFYGGESFTNAKCGGSKGRKDKVTLGKLQAAVRQKDQRKVNTLAVQNLMPDHASRVQSSMASQHQQPFLDMLSVPTVGSMNLVRHMANAEDKAQDKNKFNQDGKPVFQSINAKDLLKQHKAEMAERFYNRKQQQQQLLSQQSSHEQSLHSEGQSLSLNRRLSGQTSAADEDTVNSAATEEMKDTPMLGKGFYPGGKIDLFAETSAGFRFRPSSTEAAKRLAIQKVQAIGGLEKSDPNAVRHAPQDPEKVKKRILENIENDQKKGSDGRVCGQRRSIEPREIAEPPRKRSRLLGNVDPNSSEVKKLLNARSSHTGALAEAEAEREERYFDNLEKKEMMEEKMKTITSMEVSVVTCEQCKYTAMSQSKHCKKEGHNVRRHKGMKRFFACKKCKHRTVSLHRYPTDPCRKCGALSYEKTTMYKEKSGPKMESEILSLRGDESKFTNAMDQKVYMSTMVQ